ncbi:AAEL008571-PA [Aedes aegypti]|uniref:AAEL008571-PA n=1 Tax=Aedes aegypti TaxID=7159 RepID=Q16YD8_AEDAE|nr:AAEL008571-PB [Aedes aegypti]EAT39632.1 AAEL008571-PA [Aedes aegypti]
MHEVNEARCPMNAWNSSYMSRGTFQSFEYTTRFRNGYSIANQYGNSLLDECNNVEVCSVTEIIRSAVQKAGVTMQNDKRRVSRQFLTCLNIAQLQVIVNDLQTYIAILNDELVQLLMKRDELQMSQDATLIDIEDYYY